LNHRGDAFSLVVLMCTLPARSRYPRWMIHHEELDVEPLAFIFGDAKADSLDVSRQPA
jgi:hypothetical protein